MKALPFQTGTMTAGCNYWASHAGIFMWRQWDSFQVENDLRRLSENGIKIIRIFPLWPDFQPLEQLYGYAGEKVEVRSTTGTFLHHGDAGLAPEMLEHFHILLDLAQKYHLQVIVGILCGWMSGRLFVPRPLEGSNLLRDPAAIRLEINFIKAMIAATRDHTAIIGWDVGNECNCLAKLATRDEAWQWLHTVTSAIRVADPSRPVISGMHGLQIDVRAVWNIEDQGELTDYLTVHPYPCFTPGCSLDPLDTLRGAFHAACESRFYADLGGKPCLVEEVGTLGPVIADEETGARYLRNILWNSWAHDTRQLLWWCAFDQDHLVEPPYDWIALERELGLFRADGTAKATAKVLREFAEKTMSAPPLPPMRRHAVAILEHDGVEQWQTGYTTFLLAQQAGIQIEFQATNQPLRDAACYFLPSVSASRAPYREFYGQLLEKIHAGATLYVSMDEGFLQPFAEVFQLEIKYRSRSKEHRVLHIDHLELPVQCTFRHHLIQRNAEILDRDDSGILFARADYGTGKVYFLDCALERTLAGEPDALSKPYYRIYQLIADGCLAIRPVVRSKNAVVSVSEHPAPDGTITVLLVNNSPEDVTITPEIMPGYTANINTVPIPANDGFILTIRKQ